MKALAISPQPFFTPRGTPFSVYYRTLVLSQLGVDIDLLTYGQGQDVDIPGVRIIRIPRFKFLGPVKVGPSLLKLFLDVFLAIWTLALLLRNRYDFVHAHEESVFYCRFLRPLFGFKLLYDMHSSLPQQLTNFRYTRSKTVIGLFDRLEDSCLHSADAVITISPALAEHVLGRIPDRRRHFLIENSIFDDVRLKDPADASEGADAQKWEQQIPAGAPVVAYAGTFESYQGLDILIAAFQEVRRYLPEAFLLMVGGTPSQVASYRKLAMDNDLEGHCLFTGRLPPHLVKHLLRRADVLTSPRREGTNTPLKIYELLASGKPLVATRIVSHTQVLDEAVCFLAEPQAGPFGEAIVAAVRDQNRRRQVVERAQALYQGRYSRQAYERKMRSLLEVLA